MKQFNHIVYVLNDDTTETSSSFLRAVSLAKGNQADLTLLRIIPNIPSVLPSAILGMNTDNLESKVIAKEKEKLQTFVASVDSELNINTQVAFGKKYIEVIHNVQQNNYDLVIKEVDHIDWLDRLFGSEDMHLLRKCPCPVWLMKGNEKPDYQTIMVAIDFDDDLGTSQDGSLEELNNTLLELSLSLSLSDFTTLHIVNTYHSPQAGFISLWADEPDKVELQLLKAEYKKRQEKMNALLENLKHKVGADAFNYLSPRTHIVQGPASRELPKLATTLEADLVVMGTVARTGISGVLIGNTAENVLSQLKCSVLAVKPKNFTSPV